MTVPLGAALVALIATTAHANPPEPQDNFGEATATCDFNADSHADLAIGAPIAEVPASGHPAVPDAGTVHVLYGTAGGLQTAAPAREIWHGNNLGMGASARTGGRFGAALGTGDFNGDGFCDLAVGSPTNAPFLSPTSSGFVNVLYGSATGLRGASVPGIPETMYNAQTFDQEDAGEVVEAWDSFGWRLAGGDFDNDGFDDLAVGVSGEDVGTKENAGVVNVIYGSPQGLQRAGLAGSTHEPHTIQQELQGPGFAIEADDLFGAGLAAADFNGDGYADLAVGAPGEDEGPANVGRVSVFFGHGLGLGQLVAGHQELGEKDLEGAAAATGNERFGARLAAGDFNHDGRADLVIGVPEDSYDGLTGAGSVNVLYGTAGLLAPSGWRQFHQDFPAQMVGVAEAGDWFGSALATGDLNGDGFDDLVVGVPWERVGGGPAAAGFFNVLYGTAYGLTTSQNFGYSQNSTGVLGVEEVDDLFGKALALGDFNHDGRDDLAVGVPHEDVVGSGGTTVPNSGAVNVLPGSPSGVSTLNDQVWGQDGLNPSGS
jgi:hypothetical protein